MAWIVSMARRIFGRRQGKTELVGNGESELRSQQLAAANALVDKLRQVQSSASGSAAAAVDPALAGAFVIQSRMLYGLDRFADALPSAIEGIEIYRRLAAAGRADAQTHLADALQLVSLVLGNLDRYEESLLAAEESIAIFRQLAAANSLNAKPAALADTLVLRGKILANLDRFEEALTATDEGLDLWRGLAKADPAAHSDALADTLSLRGAILTALDRPGDARAAVEEAMEVLQLRVDAAQLSAETAVRDFLNDLP
jgi:tetratricopeptide (TPR) repeat protein